MDILIPPLNLSEMSNYECCMILQNFPKHHVVCIILYSLTEIVIHAFTGPSDSSGFSKREKGEGRKVEEKRGEKSHTLSEG